MRFSSLVVTMPASSVREWLDHELEVRGIDAVIYTRYILSILQQDNYIHEPPEREFFPIGGKKKENVVGNGTKRKSKQKVNKTRIVDCEELKKSAAVECLMSVTEQKCGIKELVEELCSRLKSIQIEGTYTTTQEGLDKQPVLYENSCSIANCEEHSSPEEQAEKYYAAFPSLSGSSEFSDESGGALSNQHTSIWDRKKIQVDSEECIAFDDDDNDATVPNVKREEKDLVASTDDSKFGTLNCPTAPDTSDDATSVLNSTKRSKTKTAIDVNATAVAAKHVRHHRQIKLKSSIKLPKICRDHYVCRKPSFIVPKYKCRILKERVQFHKERSPFNLYELTARCLSCKRESADKTYCSECKKWEDNDVDSSFEDGDSEEVATHNTTTVSKSISILLPSEVFPTVEDAPLLKLEAKFNDNLAAIWMELPIQSPVVDGTKRNNNNDLMSWIASLQHVSDGADGFGHLLEMFDGYHARGKETQNLPTKFPCNDNDEERYVENSKGYLSVFDHLLNGSVSQDRSNCSESSAETAALKNLEDSNRVWKCEGRMHGFIKGGVYGFEALESYFDVDDSSDIGTLAMDSDTLGSCSPAFDSDGEALLDWWKEKTCDSSADLREDDMKLIWEVLGTIGDSETATLFDDSFAKLPSVNDHLSCEGESMPSNVWEQLDYVDRWKIDKDLLSSYTWDCAFGTSANDCRLPNVSVWSGFASETSTEKCKSMSSLIEEALRIQWRDDHDGLFCHTLLDVGDGRTEDSLGKISSVQSDTGIVINARFSANTEELLKMTRSYDSYLNRGLEEEDEFENGLSRNQSVNYRSDPVLFDKQCTLTHHKGESLFVEVQPRFRTDLLAVDDLRCRFLTDRLRNVGELTEDGRKMKQSLNPTPVKFGADDYDGENLLTSPMTHFRPIRQFSCDSDDTAASSSGGDVDGVIGGIAAGVAESGIVVEKDADGVKHPCEEKEVEVEEKPVFFEDDNGILRLSGSNSADIDVHDNRYMTYKCQDVKQDATAPSTFVPKFKLRSDLEKYCQTEDPESLNDEENTLESKESGNGIEGGDRGMEKQTSDVLNCELRENITHREIFCLDTCPSPFINETNHAWGTTTSVFPLEACRRVVGQKSVGKSSDSVEKLTAYGIETLNFKEYVGPGTSSSSSSWGLGIVGEQQPLTSWPIVSSDYRMAADNLRENYLWSAAEFSEEVMESEELKSMKEEIKNEEAELFEDINQMRALDLHSEWIEDDSNADALEWSATSLKEVYQELAAVDYHEDEDCPELEMINGGDEAGKHNEEEEEEEEEEEDEEEFEKWSRNIDDARVELAGDRDQDNEKRLSSARVDYQLFKVSEEENGVLSNKFPSIPTCNVIYSADLEEEWIRAEKPFDVQMPKMNQSNKTRSRCNRKPCSFFMDGSCRRTDCKFSHDLASITCRFWEEGSCFKGITCPFLHGYPRLLSPVFIINSNCKEKNFKLESEADFPSLSKSVESTSSGSWIPSSFSAKRKKKRNRHRSTSIVSKDCGTVGQAN